MSEGILRLVSRDFFDDDYDPLAPQGLGQDEVSDDADDLAGDFVEPEHDSDLEQPQPYGHDYEPDPEVEGSEGDGGFGDGEGIVRVWFDERGRLERVRLHQVWYKALDSGDTLQNAFARALMAASLSIPAVGDEEPADYRDLDFGDLPPFSRESMEAYIAMIEDHKAQWDEALARAQEAGSPAPQTVTGRVKGVTVTLDNVGRPTTVDFDERWLDDARVGTICKTVVAAANAAYERFVPTEDEHQLELDRFRLEHEVLLAGFHALLKPRG